MVTSVEEACSRAESIGFPIMVKASEGGGGKGIRKATNMEDRWFSVDFAGFRWVFRCFPWVFGRF